MIDEILPDQVRSAEVFHDPTGVTLFPAEEAAIVKAVHKRRQEFTSVRFCARKALVALGYPETAVVPGERGAPQWPDKVVGSMTHCAGYRAAALASVANVVTIGIDAEPNAPLPDGVLDAVACPEEQQRLRDLHGAGHDVHWDRLLFSAKESVYKAWFPLTGRWLGFHEVALRIDSASATFSAHLLVPGPEVQGRCLQAFDGRWLARDGLVITAIALTGHGGRG